jgi:hypothetical protein
MTSVTYGMRKSLCKVRFDMYQGVMLLCDAHYDKLCVLFVNDLFNNTISNLYRELLIKFTQAFKVVKLFLKHPVFCYQVDCVPVRTRMHSSMRFCFYEISTRWKFSSRFSKSSVYAMWLFVLWLSKQDNLSPSCGWNH